MSGEINIETIKGNSESFIFNRDRRSIHTSAEGAHQISS